MASKQAIEDQLYLDQCAERKKAVKKDERKVQKIEELEEKQEKYNDKEQNELDAIQRSIDYYQKQILNAENKEQKELSILEQQHSVRISKLQDEIRRLEDAHSIRVQKVKDELKFAREYNDGMIEKILRRQENIKIHINRQVNRVEKKKTTLTNSIVNPSIKKQVVIKEPPVVEQKSKIKMQPKKCGVKSQRFAKKESSDEEEVVLPLEEPEFRQKYEDEFLEERNQQRKMIEDILIQKNAELVKAKAIYQSVKAKDPMQIDRDELDDMIYEAERDVLNLETEIEQYTELLPK